MANRDLAGQLGESLASAALLRPLPDRDFLFRPSFLGDKWPTVDFLVELVGANTRCFFLAQVRLVSALPNLQQRLPISFNRDALQALMEYPVPTYLLGVNAINRQVYVVSTNGEFSVPEAGITIQYPLSDDSVMLNLWDEVHTFWQARSVALPKLTSNFIDPRWRTQ